MGKLKGYKTIIFNALALAIAILQYYEGPLPTVEPELFACVVGVGNLALRFMTNTSVFSKE